MQKFLIPFLGFLILATAGAAPTPKLHVGSVAPKIEVSSWVKGAPVNDLHRGHVYVVEFWATWCPPCRESIPHLTEFAKQYKNITFVGVSAFENNQADVVPFVKQMGSKMDYHVALDKQSSPTARVGYMAEKWMAAANQDGIPTAFIVGKNGKIAWIGSPFSLAPELKKFGSPSP